MDAVLEALEKQTAEIQELKTAITKDFPRSFIITTVLSVIMFMVAFACGFAAHDFFYCR